MRLMGRLRIVPPANCISPRRVRGCDGITVSIGTRLADVRFAGRVGPGLHQIDVVVLAHLPSGDHRVIVSVVEMGTWCEGLLKIANRRTCCLTRREDTPISRGERWRRTRFQQIRGLSSWHQATFTYPAVPTVHTNRLCPKAIFTYLASSPYV